MDMKKAIALILILAAGTAAAQPRLVSNGTATQLEVCGERMLMIGGELGNSSASTLEDCRTIFPKLHAMGLNTVLAPAYWELIEPEEGKFDLTSVRDVIDEARVNGLKVVFLWFGAWKNSMSCYAPEWFKKDTKSYPRVHLRNGTPLEEASSLSAGVLKADSRAFCRLVSFIKEYDSAEQTVVMLQVENEIGMVNSPRDYSADADRMYNGAVPKELVNYLNTNRPQLHPSMAERFKPEAGKTWAAMFGNDIYAEEIFQAWTYAVYVEQLAKAGKKIYDIPMYVNVALNSRGRKPGQYPSGGPLAHLIDVWHCGAPSIDVLGLDLYDKGFRDWTAKYHLHNNPLFIPEIRLEDEDGVRALYAFGHHDAMGFCPFSIEDYDLGAKDVNSASLKKEDLAKDDQLNLFPTKVESGAPLVRSYSLLRQLEPLILKYQGTDDLFGVHLDNGLREDSFTTADGIRFTVKHSYSLGWEAGAAGDEWPEAGCLVIRTGAGEYLIAGSGVVVTFDDPSRQFPPKDGDCVGIAKCEKVEFPVPGGEAHILRHFSGDQTHQGRHVRIPVGDWQIQRFKLYRY